MEGERKNRPLRIPLRNVVDLKLLKAPFRQLPLLARCLSGDCVQSPQEAALGAPHGSPTITHIRRDAAPGLLIRYSSQTPDITSKSIKLCLADNHEGPVREASRGRQREHLTITPSESLYLLSNDCSVLALAQHAASFVNLVESKLGADGRDIMMTLIARLTLALIRRFPRSKSWQRSLPKEEQYQHDSAR